MHVAEPPALKLCVIPHNERRHVEALSASVAPSGSRSKVHKIQPVALSSRTLARARFSSPRLSRGLLKRIRANIWTQTWWTTHTCLLVRFLCVVAMKDDR